MSSLRQAYYKVAGPALTPTSQPMTLTGLANGDSELNKDFSSEPVDVWIQPKSNEDWQVAFLTFVISATGSFNRTDFGSIPNGLTNGISFFADINGNRQIITQGPPIKNNQDLLRNNRQFSEFNFAGGDDSLFAETLFFDYSLGFTLQGSRNDKFGVILNDDFTSQTQFQIYVSSTNLGLRSV